MSPARFPGLPRIQGRQARVWLDMTTIDRRPPQPLLDAPAHLDRHIVIEPAPEGYRAGVCNIGPDEIARRRRSGIVATAGTAGLLAMLLAVGAPRPARLVVALPAAMAAGGFLQARARFCVRFGSAGIYNFGRIGEGAAVVDPEARRRDLIRSAELGAAVGAIGAGVGIAALLLPTR